MQMLWSSCSAAMADRAFRREARIKLWFKPSEPFKQTRPYLSRTPPG
jgi:hypothetical protein